MHHHHISTDAEEDVLADDGDVGQIATFVILLDLPELLSVPFHLLGDSSLECSQTPFTNFDHVD